MKIIICGPPHSGKSVFVNNLRSLLPSDALQVIMANGDGEGYWTNNDNQNEIDKARKEYKSYTDRNTPEAFVKWRNRIANSKKDIVLVDIGGLLDDTKKTLFEVCDSFIVVSRDKDVKRQWIELGTGCNSKCIASIDSVLEGENILRTTGECIEAQIARLERGNKSLSETKELRAIAELILNTIDYKRIVDIEFLPIAIELDMCHKWITSNGREIYTINNYDLGKAVQIYDYIKNKYPRGLRYRVKGANYNWEASVIAFCLCKSDVSDISFWDEWTSCYITPKKLISRPLRRLQSFVI
ncbi:MAG: ATP-binding protein [Bacteroidaceae bacterium]|nr:ATP-binding protein [Bacteroidaceae bacterium]